MKKEITEIILWIIILSWISIISVWLRDSVVAEKELDRKLEIQKVCLSEKLNRDFAWKIDFCGDLINPRWQP